MILSCQDKPTQRLADGSITGKYPYGVEIKAIEQLKALGRAYSVESMDSPPGNRLKKLKGDLQGFYSIRINDQYRILFRWENGNASDVLVSKHYE